MKKNVIGQCFIGALIGLTISYTITIIISVLINSGEFYPVVPQLIKTCGNELNAVIVQTVFSMVYGAVMAGSMFIWTIDNWSILKQTVVHCIVISVTSLPIAYILYWMPHTVTGIIIYILIFFAIYFFIWITLYFSIKKQIKAINKKVNDDLISK